MRLAVKAARVFVLLLLAHGCFMLVVEAAVLTPLVAGELLLCPQAVAVAQVDAIAPVLLVQQTQVEVEVEQVVILHNPVVLAVLA